MQRGANLLLRAGVAFAFLYPPLDAIANPDSWLGYFPPFTRGYVPDLVLLHVFGAIEIIIALWIVWGRKAYIPAAAAVVLLCAIVFFDRVDFELLFRDLSIAAAAAALCVQSYYDEVIHRREVRQL